MKSHKVYPNKGDSRLIVCFKGSHYISPFETQVGKGQRVPVTVGEQPDTVIVAGNEVWSLKGPVHSVFCTPDDSGSHPEFADCGARDHPFASTPGSTSTFPSTSSRPHRQPRRSSHSSAARWAWTSARPIPPSPRAFSS